MKRKVKMTKRIAWQIQRYIAITEAMHSLQTTVKTIEDASKQLAYLPVRSSTRSGITGARRRILYELEGIKKEIKALEEKRYSILRQDARIAIKFAIEQQIVRFFLRDKPNNTGITDTILFQLGAENISQALRIPLGTVLNDKVKKT